MEAPGSFNSKLSLWKINFSFMTFLYALLTQDYVVGVCAVDERATSCFSMTLHVYVYISLLLLCLSHAAIFEFLMHFRKARTTVFQFHN